jgi:hypothetical protein
MTRTLYAFDTDGTLETSGGVVKTKTLQKLVDSGHHVVIVSQSPLFPRGGDDRPLFPVLGSLDRVVNLRSARAAYPRAQRFVYVSDNQDREVARLAGFEYVQPWDFRP